MRRISHHLTRLGDRLRYRLGRHRRSVAWTALAAVLALGGGVGAGALTAGSSPAGATAAPASSPATTPLATPSTTAGKSSAHAARARRIRGTVVAVTAGSWTLRTAKGATVTVTITPSTRFGARITPGHVTPGTTVIVAGQRSDQAWTATLVVGARPHPAGGPTASSPPASTAPTTAPAAG